ncbi:MAG: hypothetical protein QM571_05725 [Micrococcaceae bacterium]
MKKATIVTTAVAATAVLGGPVALAEGAATIAHNGDGTCTFTASGFIPGEQVLVSQSAGEGGATAMRTADANGTVTLAPSKCNGFDGNW